MNMDEGRGGVRAGEARVKGENLEERRGKRSDRKGKVKGSERER